MTHKPNNRKSSFFLIIDILFVCFSFTLLAWYKPSSVHDIWATYTAPVICFLSIWIISSTIAQKYRFRGKYSFTDKLKSVFIANVVILAINLSLLYLLEISAYSRLLIFGTVGLTTFFEIVLTWQIIAYQKTNRQFFFESDKRNQADILKDHFNTHLVRKQYSESMREGIINLSSQEIFDFIKEHMPENEEDIYFTATRRAFNIEHKPGNHKAIVNLQTLNTTADLNYLFKTTNERLPDNGYYFSIAETIVSRKKRIKNKSPFPINQLVYLFDYLYHRVFAKIYPTRLVYRLLKHKNRAISKAELLGRLYAAGFEIIDEDIVNDTFVFIARKIGKPQTIDYEAIGSLIKLKRLGKDGKVIGVYKFRTMHPYSEYIQEYVYKKNDLQEGGKFKEDFRINRLGRYMRKMWIDELPMFLNVAKGEMKIVGVRPLSKHYFSLYTKELQDLRTSTKPGLLPPFYADTPVTLDEIMASEMRYLKAYKKHPRLTDIRYFFKILNNIIVKGARSK